MHIRTFRAANLNDALKLIREQMGPDATVLHTRQIRSNGWKVWDRTKIEVTAGLRHQSFQQVQVDAEQEDDLLHQLVDLGISLKLAKEWRGQVKAGGLDGLTRWLAGKIPIADPISIRSGHPRIVSLVGATGVGKTTTIAKLAGQFCIDQRSRVGLLTVDAFRAAAVEQLEAFAEALQIPLEVVRQLDDVEPALEQLTDVDLLLVDTIGQSPRESSRLDRLTQLLREIGPDETYLVLDANSSLAAARDCLKSFAGLDPTALILSKVDEVSLASPAIAAVMEWNQKADQGTETLGFSYVTNGQSVPRDIALAEAGWLANMASGLAMDAVGSVMSSS